MKKGGNSSLVGTLERASSDDGGFYVASDLPMYVCMYVCTYVFPIIRCCSSDQILTYIHKVGNYIYIYLHKAVAIKKVDLHTYG